MTYDPLLHPPLAPIMRETLLRMRDACCRTRSSSCTLQRLQNTQELPLLFERFVWLKSPSTLHLMIHLQRDQADIILKVF